ncbi:tyrosine-type recombinase/integrase [Streptomyces sp. NPDC005407]|uniref:tyrosine-type recombinase/integrase n=1 Tax=Streptomyces sp. NPDC005407 TaxID=3155340 RepID=UPI0033B41C09
MMGFYRAERALRPVDGSIAWVVVGEDFSLHEEACAFLAGLRARGRSSNTERVYAGRVAVYLSWCEANGVDCTRPALLDLARFLRWLVAEPLPARSRDGSGVPRFRSEATANAVMTGVCEFLRFGARHGWVPAEVAASLTEPRYLAYLPSGFDPGEQGQFRNVRARMLKYSAAVEGPQWLSDEQIEQLRSAAVRGRDRLLVSLLACTGMRIGEALGLHRQDMHLLSNSAMLGCQVTGPHVHVRRRLDANGALAKSRFPRWIPVTEELVDAYTEYLHERAARVSGEADSEAVFVNLYAGRLGRPMTYVAAKDMFDRLARRVGFEARPHMLRHSAATRWIRSGIERDVVQRLLGHASASSLDVYLHADDDELRDAVTRVAAGREAGA